MRHVNTDRIECRPDCLRMFLSSESVIKYEILVLHYRLPKDYDSWGFPFLLAQKRETENIKINNLEKITLKICIII